MKVESSFIIDGKIVELVSSFAGITVYRNISDAYEDTLELYFVKADTGEVVQILRVDADCAQNSGFINGFMFTRD